jgi:glycosyltransferase involved in cell wall biosynthesis
MRLIYLLLSPTFGMHQYTADLANRMAAELGMEVHLVTTANLPRDRYSPAVRIHTPVVTHGTGFAPEGLNPAALRRVLQTVDRVASGRWQVASAGTGVRQGGDDLGNLQPATCNLQPATCIHITGVHLWNLALVPALRRRGYRVVHTLHDLDPHVGVRFPALIRLWNRLIVRWADRLLVHGEVYRQRLLAQGVAPGRVVAVPLLHGFLSYLQSGLPAALSDQAVACEPWALFFGRLEQYKGVGVLLHAAQVARQAGNGLRLALAGQGDLTAFWPGPLPAGVELRQRRIDDAEAIDLFRRCGLLVLPYLDASQSALVAAAYAFRKPVLVTRSGALPEYVQEGVTGWIVPPGDAPALAAAVQDALADPQRLTAMGQAGWQWYRQQRAHEYQVLLDLYHF